MIERSETPPAGVEVRALDELRAVLDRSQTLGDFQRQARERIDQVLQGGEHNGRALGEAMRRKSHEVEDAMTGFDGVRISNLPGGTLGRNLVGGEQSSAEVSAAIVLDPDELRRTVTHEAHSEVGHSSQANPKAAQEAIALIVDGQKLSITGVLEGDVEMGTARLIDGSSDHHREGQPEQDYGEGQRAAVAAVSAIGTSEWNNHLKKGGAHAGDLGHLQQALWERQLRTAQDEATVLRIVEEAEETGYTNAARQALANAA